MEKKQVVSDYREVREVDIRVVDDKLFSDCDRIIKQPIFAPLYYRVSLFRFCSSIVYSSKEDLLIKGGKVFKEGNIDLKTILFFKR